MTYKCTYTFIKQHRTIQIQKHMHIHRIQIHIKQMHSKTSQKQRMQIHRIGMMNGWGFALSPPYSMLCVFLIPYQ